MAEPLDFEPVMSIDTAFYWEGARRGELVVQRCARCGVLRHPPSPVCAACRSLGWSAVAAPRRGTLHSVAKVHHPGSPLQEDGYLVCLVDLADGVRVAANLRGCSVDAAEIGMTVELFFEPLAGGFELPQFRPAS
jgi:uncharacterized OB-fold protein